jgi:hypothetical protein
MTKDEVEEYYQQNLKDLVLEPQPSRAKARARAV